MPRTDLPLGILWAPSLETFTSTPCRQARARLLCPVPHVRRSGLCLQLARHLHRNRSYLSASPPCHCQTHCSHLSLDNEGREGGREEGREGGKERKGKREANVSFYDVGTFIRGSTKPRFLIQKGCFLFDYLNGMDKPCLTKSITKLTCP